MDRCYNISYQKRNPFRPSFCLHWERSFLRPDILPCVFAYVIMWLSDSGSIKTPSTYRGAKEKLWRSHFFPSSRLILHEKDNSCQRITIQCLSLRSRRMYCFCRAHGTECSLCTGGAVENEAKWNRIKDLRSFSFLPCLKNEACWILFTWKIILTAGWTMEQMSLSPGKFLKVTKHQKEGYDSGSNIRNRFGGFQIAFLRA